MFDDCNTFFKGKPDGRDECRTGAPGMGGNATSGPRRARLQRSGPGNFYTALISRARRRKTGGLRPKVSRGPPAAHDTLGRYGLPQSARAGPAPMAHKDCKRADRVSLRLLSVPRACGLTATGVALRVSRATATASASEVRAARRRRSARKAKGRPELSAVGHRTKYRARASFPRETFVRHPTSARSSPHRTP